MIPRPTPERFRLRRTMMFLSAQKPGLIKDAYIYGADSLILDLEDAVAENQKDAARFSLYHTLTTVDYGDTEVLVRINGLDTPHWREDVRVAVAAGADGIRIAKCESAADIRQVEHAVEQAEAEFGVEPGRTLLMAALESPKGVLNSYEICCASNRMLGIALSGGDFRKCMQTVPQPDGVTASRWPPPGVIWFSPPGRPASSALTPCSPTWTTWRASAGRSPTTTGWASTARASSTPSRSPSYMRSSPPPKRRSPPPKGSSGPSRSRPPRASASLPSTAR